MILHPKFATQTYSVVYSNPTILVAIFTQVLRTFFPSGGPWEFGR